MEEARVCVNLDDREMNWSGVNIKVLPQLILSSFWRQRLSR